MTKHSADPGIARVIVDGAVANATVPERWIGSGRVVRDNKGEPVKQYEPYYADSDRWDDDPRLDAVRPSSVLIRDPLGRVVKTVHQDGSYAEVTFSPWHELHADENHTAAAAGWTPVAVGVAQLDTHAASAMTNLRGAPGRTVLDTLGRPVRTVAYDQGREIPTRTELDLAGDPLGVTIEVTRPTLGGSVELAVRTYVYDLARRPYLERGVDDGRKLSLVAPDGKPLGMLTARGYLVATQHDRLRRVIAVRVTPPTGAPFTAERHEYGEAAPTDAQAAGNLRGKPWRVRDATGETVFAYDHAGNAVSAERRLFAEVSDAIDVDDDLAFGPDVFTTRTEYDALARPVAQAVAPDRRRQTREYGRDGRLRRVSLDGATVATLAHDARGLRESITYGNAVATRYVYDERTLRLASLVTSPAGKPIQDYRYGYDAVGNILWTDDQAQPVTSHNNREVRARSLYRYDGLNRLIAATGREHRDQNQARDQVVVPGVPSVPGDARDPQRLRMYTETYVYDDAGNILEMAHAADGATQWRRQYRYAYDLPASMGVSPSSRLWSTGVRGDATRAEPLDDYKHDDHGNMIAMPSLPDMVWDWREAMVRSSVAPGGAQAVGGLEYACDAAGQRVRKRWTGTGSDTTRTERLYLGMLEDYREYRGVELTLERRSVHVMDDERRVLLAEQDLAIENYAATDVVTARLYRYQLDDHLGSSRLELGGAISLTDDGELSAEDFHPYGTSAWTATDDRFDGRPKRYRFTSMERDSETGLAMHGIRYYAPWLARWTSPDPVTADHALYSYSQNCPSRLVDTQGRQAARSATEPVLPNGALPSQVELDAMSQGGASELAAPRVQASMRHDAIGGVAVSDLGGGVIMFRSRSTQIDADGDPFAYHPLFVGKRSIGNPRVPQAKDYFANSAGLLVKDRSGRNVIQGPGDPAPGYAVSATSYHRDSDLPRTDPRRYYDSSAVVYVALPHGKKGHRGELLGGAHLGDIVVMFNAATGRIAFGIVADAGPHGKAGEVSELAAQELGIEGSARSVRTPGDVYYFVFPHTEQRAAVLAAAAQRDWLGALRAKVFGTRPPLTQSVIEARAQAVFNASGGLLMVLDQVETKSPALRPRLERLLAP